MDSPDTTYQLANGLDWYLKDSDKVKCNHEGCNEAGDPCYLELDEVHEYLCPKHCEENGYCTGCGTFIAGWIDFGSLCDNCSDELESDTWEEDDEDYCDEDIY